MVKDIEVLFKGFSDEDKEEFLTVGVRKDFPLGEVVIEEGKEGSNMYIIEKGRVSVWFGGIKLAEVTEGDTLGSQVIIEQYARTATVKAEAPCVLLRFERADLMKFFKDKERLFKRFFLNVFNIQINLIMKLDNRIVELDTLLEFGEERIFDKVLVIDDHTSQREMASDILKASYQVIEARNGEEGFNRVTAEIPDLVILDINLPDTDSHKLCQRIKEDSRTSHIPIIMLTPLSDTPDKVKAMMYGADEYLIEPFEWIELIDKVQMVLKSFYKGEVK